MMNPDTLLPILDDLIDAYRDPHVFKFLHLPVQSGSDEILKLMHRRYTVADFRATVKKFRNAFPQLTLSTDVIAGFPGETEDRFKKTVDLIKEVQPNIVNIKGFSPRAKTMAATMESRVHGRTIKARTRALTKLRFEISSRLNKQLVGKEEVILITELGKKPNTVIGRTDSYNAVVIRENINVGTLARVKIVDCTDSYLIAELLRTGS
jgi:MiaB/RimO family radical SAM methylthiotransferase